MYPHGFSDNNVNATGQSNVDPQATDPLTVFAIVAMFGLLFLILAAALRWCVPTISFGDTARSTDDRHERQRKRMEYIHKVLKTHPWRGNAATIDKVPPSPISSSENISVPSGGSDDPSDAQQTTKQLDPESTRPRQSTTMTPKCLDTIVSFLSDEPTCAICLSNFVDNDIVCESNNQKCTHVFHQDCLEPWLLRHEHCPVCRELYLHPTRHVSSSSAARRDAH